MSTDSPTEAAPEADVVDRRVAEERLALLFRSNPRGLASTSIFGVAMALVLWGEAPKAALGLWLLSLLGVVALRLALALSYEQRAPGQPDLARWRNLFTLGAAATGMLWGALTLIFGVLPVSYQLVVGFVLIGMVSTAVGYLSAIPSVYVLYMLSALLPFTLSLAFSGAPYVYLALLAIPFVGFLIATSLSLSRAIESSLRLGLEQAVLAERLKEERDRAETASRAKSDFLSQMSHELRTPLSAILGFARLLELNAAGESSRTAAREIVDEGQHLLALISDLADLSKIERGKAPLSLSPCPLNEVAAACLDVVQASASKRRIHLIDEIPRGAACGVLIDLVHFRQALVNLLSSAVQCSADAGAIRLSCGQSSPGRLRVTIEVTAPGVTGVPQARSYNTPDRAGAEGGWPSETGIGLLIARRRAELMGGSVGFEDRAGPGSRFWIEVQREDAAGPPSSRHPDGHASPVPVDRT